MQPEALGRTEVMTRAGVTYRQLDYWCRSGLLGSRLQEETGSGKVRFYTAAEAARVVVIADLLRAGVALPAIGAAVRSGDLAALARRLREGVEILERVGVSA